MEEIKIETPYITLGQFIKFIGLIGNGAEAKEYLAMYEIIVDGIIEQRRGKKLYNRALLTIDGRDYIIMAPEAISL